MKIVTSVISIAIIITDISQMKSRILCLSIVQPLRCDLFERLNVNRLAEDTLFLPDFIVSENHCDVSGFRFHFTSKASLEFTSERANQIERNKVAVHCVSLVLCCVCHVIYYIVHPPKNQEQESRFSEDFPKVFHPNITRNYIFRSFLPLTRPNTQGGVNTMNSHTSDCLSQCILIDP